MTAPFSTFTATSSEMDILSSPFGPFTVTTPAPTLISTPCAFTYLKSAAVTSGALCEYGNARFFASTETFWIGHLCNHWTSQVLNAGGVDVRPFRSVVAAEVVAGVDRELDSGAQRD